MNKYEQLQEFLNKCIELGWKPTEEKIDSNALCKETYICFYYYWVHQLTLSYHDLFSKDSGLMEFVEWKESEYLDYKRIDTPKDYWYDTDWQYHVMIMWPMTADEKITYFLENTLLPTKQD